MLVSNSSLRAGTAFSAARDLAQDHEFQTVECPMRGRVQVASVASAAAKGVKEEAVEGRRGAKLAESSETLGGSLARRSTGSCTALEHCALRV